MMSKIPNCIFGDGCLLKLTDDHHDRQYNHTGSILPRCRASYQDGCTQYAIARDHILTGKVIENLKAAQSHVSMYYHPPYGTSPTRPPVEWVPYKSPTRSGSMEASTSKSPKIPKLNLTTRSMPASPVSKKSPVRTTASEGDLDAICSPKRSSKTSRRSGKLSDEKIDSMMAQMAIITKYVMDIQANIDRIQIDIEKNNQSVVDNWSKIRDEIINIWIGQ